MFSVSKSRRPSICFPLLETPIPDGPLAEWLIANIGSWEDIFFKAFLCFFLLLSIIFNFRVFANQPTVHNGGVSKGRALAVGVTGDMLHMTGDMLNMTLDTFFSFLP